MFEDVDGNIFLDWIGGVGVLNIGYSNPECIAAVKEQADKFFHSMFNMTTHEGYVKLAEEMNKIVPLEVIRKSQCSFARVQRLMRTLLRLQRAIQADLTSSYSQALSTAERP